MRVLESHYRVVPTVRHGYREAEARLSVEVNGKRLQAQSHAPADIPVHIVQRELQQQILQEIGKQLFG